ncbi:MAG: hypothetical protein ACKVQC_05245 [Elusimicrobiota bacterium]
MDKKVFTVAGVIVVGIVIWLLLRSCGKPEILKEEVSKTIPLPVETLPEFNQQKSSEIVKKIKTKDPVASSQVQTPPPVKIHKELIPKDIEIIRIYYAQSLSGPDSQIPFDINGSGFTKEFEKMIQVKSGNNEIQVKSLALKTPNQISGVLHVSPHAATTVNFPQVLINDKVVFQAPDPYAVIRPGEVLNLIFTEMSEAGRSGRFRIFTNLDEKMFNDFTVEPSTPSIRVNSLVPIYPFVVDGDIDIGGAPGGDYGIKVKMGAKTLWDRPGIIRVVKPNLGQSGLVQRIQSLERFYRPGEYGLFMLQGSGFQPDSMNQLKVLMDGITMQSSSFTYRSPGRIDFKFSIPKDAPARSYSLSVVLASETLSSLGDAFVVVNPNWVRNLDISPSLKPEGQALLTLYGKDLSKEFIESIQCEVDDSQIIIGKFEYISPTQAKTTISAGAKVTPGDYWIKMKTKEGPLTPQFGSIIRVEK